MRRQCQIQFKSSVLVMFACVALASTASIVKAQQCDVSIDSPKAGDRVSAIGAVNGRANIPTSGHLWILSHRAGLGDWWPQGQGPESASDGTWEVTVYYGEDRDVGSQFEVAAVVVGDAENQRLEKWVTDAPGKGYPGTRFPNTVGGCPIRKVTVLKAE